MTITTAEAVAAALVSRLAAILPTAVPGVRVIDGDPDGLSDALPPAGQVAAFFADAGAVADVQGPGPFHRETVVHLECLVAGSTEAQRRGRLRAVFDAIEAALRSDVSLGGLCSALTWERADPAVNPVEGGADTRGEIVIVTCEHLSASEL